MKPLRIMVVDDSGLTVKKMVKMLEGLGHEVAAVATTGQEAVDAYAAVAPDIVAMDITMPDLDGIEATRRIMAVSPDARIVIVTSHGQEQMVMDAIEAGAKGYILKPVKPEKLKETLETVAAKYLA
ncbi:response regulator [Solidesulfovibrio sp.]|mgnify:FL=1|jgi:two-component system chemotaxis response regulator CheY|uniref:response regulator n=1 Tax=Solidesulfovibrio sp. TaxID=2910990 RepID=UPI000EE3880E|nr:response regulator [Solidesulfovibrio sp.]MEA5090735.1 response regulator [Solidesulfovibrio sp.]HCR12947.1 response regulator [Desulfovibrio sp.]HML62122.1 response regulator [Solidesulfovibrio sp.]